MVGVFRGHQDIAIVGANHRTGSVALRDRLFIEDPEIESVSAQLRESGAEGVLVLSTCDRIELVIAGERADLAIDVARDFLMARAAGEDGLTSALYTLEGEEACRHLFRVASSLESQVIGEPQVLGQVKAAHRLARQADAMSSGLDTVLQAAYGAAKEVRTETRIGERPVSIAAAAAALARDTHGELEDTNVIVIGDGDMGAIVAEALLGRGVQDMTVVHDRRYRAEALAEHLGCHVADLGTLSDILHSGDIVITARGLRGYTLTDDMVRHALNRRRHRPMLLLDLAVPGDADPAINRLDDVYMFDLAELDALAVDGAQSREAELPAASAIVERHLSAMLGAAVERDAVPALTKLRHRVELIREQVLLEAAGDAEKATRLLVGRLLHDPTVNLRRLAREDGPEAIAAAEQLLETLFRETADGVTQNGDNNGD